MCLSQRGCDDTLKAISKIDGLESVDDVAISLKCDISDQDQVKAMCDELSRSYFRVLQQIWNFHPELLALIHHGMPLALVQHGLPVPGWCANHDPFIASSSHIIFTCSISHAHASECAHPTHLHIHTHRRTHLPPLDNPFRYEAAASKFGDRMDVLVNNAAYFNFHSVETAEPEDWDRSCVSLCSSG